MLNLHSITTNYCISAAWHGGSELVALLRCHYSRSCFDSSLQVVCMCFFIFLLTVLCRFSEGFRSGKLAAQSDALIRWSENHSVVVLALWTGAEAWEEKIGILMKPVSRWKSRALWNLLVDGCIDSRLNRTQWINQHQHRQGTRLPKSSQAAETLLWTLNTLGYVSLHLSSRIRDLNLLMKCKNTLDHWSAVYFFLSLAQVWYFWHCPRFRRGLILGMQQL